MVLATRTRCMQITATASPNQIKSTDAPDDVFSKMRRHHHAEQYYKSREAAVPMIFACPLL